MQSFHPNVFIEKTNNNSDSSDANFGPSKNQNKGGSILLSSYKNESASVTYFMK